MTSVLQRGMSDFQQYPLHLRLIQDFIDILIHKARNFHVTLSVPELNLHLYKWEYLPHCCLHKGLKGTIVNWTCHLKLCLQLGFPPDFRVKVYIRKWSGNFFRIHSGFHLIRKYPGIPVYATNFRIIPFPKWKFFSGKMETLVLKHMFRVAM